MCLGAHSDDIEIGCGGTILQLLSPYSECAKWFGWFSAPGGSGSGKPAPAPLCFCKQAKRQTRVIVKNFRDGFFPYQGAEIKEFFEELKKDVNPDLIFTHYRNDRHQDHRTISDLTWNTWRQHLILEYEIPKYDGDLGSPNCFVPLSKDDLCAQDQEHLRCVRDPKQQGMADRGYLSGDLAVARGRVRRARQVRRGLLLPQICTWA